MNTIYIACAKLSKCMNNSTISKVTWYSTWNGITFGRKGQWQWKRSLKWPKKAVTELTR